MTMIGHFSRRAGLLLAGIAGLALAGVASPDTASAAGGPKNPPPDVNWSFSGPFGTYDRGALQRGFHVYDAVCSSCHGLKQLDYRHLRGIGLSEDEVKAIAASKFVIDAIPDEFGDPVERPGIPSDDFVSPFPNEQAARAANNGAYPWDLSLMAKARMKGDAGADYIAAFLQGYDDTHESPPGQYYNKYYYAGEYVGMPNVLFDGGVEYLDGTEATVEQQAKDVAHFLMWAAEPHMEDRKQAGVASILFLVVFAGILYMVKRRIWADVH